MSVACLEENYLHCATPLSYNVELISASKASNLKSASSERNIQLFGDLLSLINQNILAKLFIKICKFFIHEIILPQKNKQD